MFKNVVKEIYDERQHYVVDFQNRIALMLYNQLFGLSLCVLVVQICHADSRFLKTSSLHFFK